MIRLALLLSCLVHAPAWGQLFANEPAQLRQLQPAPDSLNESSDSRPDDDPFNRQYGSWAELAQFSQQEKAPVDLVLILGKATGKRLQQHDWPSLRRVRNVQRLYVQLATPLTQPLADSLLSALATWPTLETVGLDVPDYGPYELAASASPIDGRLGLRLRSVKQLHLSFGQKRVVDGLRLFGQCPSLRRLILSLPGDSLGSLPAELARLQQVRELALFNATSAATVGAVLAGLPSLTALSLDCPFGGRQLTECLRYVPDLRSLEVSWRPTEAALTERRLPGPTLTGLRVAGLRRLERVGFRCLTRHGQPVLLGTILAGATSLRHVALAGFTLTSLDWLADLPNLERLDAQTDLHLRKPPTRSLRHLRKLAVVRIGESRGWQPALPALATLPNLTELSLIRTRLRRLPAAIGNLRSLTALDLSGNGLRDVPAELGRLSRLTRLSVADNGLTALPALSGLTNLTYVDASRNRLTRLPGVGRLTQLRHLAVAVNRLAQLPADLVHCRQLTYLNASGNPLTRLPDALGRLDSLQHLFVRNTSFTQLPASIGRLRRLREVEVGSDALNRLPDELSACTQLRRLAITSKSLTALPARFGGLHQLTDLTLSCSALQRLPDDLGQLTALTQLALYCPQLSQLPAGLGDLAQLTELRIYSNQLRSLPEEVGRLTNLRRLTISGSTGAVRGQLTQLPARIADCVGLCEVEIQHQRAFDGADAITKLARLSSLYRLTLDDAGIESLAGVDWKTVLLKSIHLPNNRLRDLPPTMPDMPNLLGLNLYGNPLPPALATTFGNTQELRIALLSTRLANQPTDKPDVSQMQAYLERAGKGQQPPTEEAVLADYALAIQIAPDTLKAYAYSRRAEWYMFWKKYVPAIADFRQIIASVNSLGKVPPGEQGYVWRDPAQLLASYWNRLGDAYQGAGQYEQAASALEQGLGLLVTDTEDVRYQKAHMQMNLAEAYARQRNAPKARASLLSAHALFETVLLLPRERLLELQCAVLSNRPDLVATSSARFVKEGQQTILNMGELTEYVHLMACHRVLTNQQTPQQAHAALRHHIRTRAEFFTSHNLGKIEALLPGVGLSARQAAALLSLTRLAKQYSYEATEKQSRSKRGDAGKS